MNPYAAVDPALQFWARRHGLYVLTRSHHETELRQVNIVDNAGDIYGVSLTAPDDDTQVNITLYSVAIGEPHRTPRKQLFRCHLMQLHVTLELVYATVETWIKEQGHLRTPTL